MNRRHASTAFLIVTLMLGACATAHANDERLGQTRFGRLSIGKYGGPLLLDEHPIRPEIRGNESLDILRVFRVGSSDVVLVQDNGGSGCPAQMMFVTLNKSGISASDEFGTCATELRASQRGDRILVTMPLLDGHGAKRFIFSRGLVTEVGKPIN